MVEKQGLKSNLSSKDADSESAQFSSTRQTDASDFLVRFEKSFMPLAIGLCENNKERAEDLLQETSRKVFQSATATGLLMTEEEWKDYFHVALTNNWRTQGKKESRRNEVSYDQLALNADGEGMRDPPSEIRRAFEHFCAKERDDEAKERLWALIQKYAAPLEETERRILELIFEGFSIEEIAQILGMEASSAKYRFAYLRKKIRRRIKGCASRKVGQIDMSYMVQELEPTLRSIFDEESERQSRDPASKFKEALVVLEADVDTTEKESLSGELVWLLRCVMGGSALWGLHFHSSHVDVSRLWTPADTEEAYVASLLNYIADENYKTHIRQTELVIRNASEGSCEDSSEDNSTETCGQVHIARLIDLVGYEFLMDTLDLSDEMFEEIHGERLTLKWRKYAKSAIQTHWASCSRCQLLDAAHEKEDAMIESWVTKGSPETFVLNHWAEFKSRR